MSRYVRFVCPAVLLWDASRLKMRQPVRCSRSTARSAWSVLIDKPEFAFAGRMTKMVKRLNNGTPHDLGGVSCWTCHRGNVKPARMPRASWRDRLDKWPESLKLSTPFHKYINVSKRGGVGSQPAAASQAAWLRGGPRVRRSARRCPTSQKYVSELITTVRGQEDAEKPAREVYDDERVCRGPGRLLRLLPPPYFEKSRQPSMQCYTSHRVRPSPNAYGLTVTE